MKHILFRIATKVTIFATVFLTVLGAVTPAAYAASFDDVQMTLSRVQISTTPSTTFVIDLPAAVDWDATTASDTITLDFPSTIDLSGTWTSTDFTITDGANITVSTTDSNLAQSAVAGTYFTDAVCVGTQNSGFADIAVNTADEAIKIRRCGGGGAPDPQVAGNIIISIQNKASGGGVLTLPGTAANNILTEVSMTDDNGTYSDILATSVINVDSSAPAAPAPTTPTMTFELSQDKTAAPTALQSCDAGLVYASGGPVIGFSTPMSFTQINNATSTICTSVTSTAGSIATVYAWSLYGGLTSDSGSTYIATAVHSSASEITYSTESSRDDGVCVVGSGDTGVGSGISGNVTSTATYSGNCDWTSPDVSQTFGTLTKASVGIQALWSAEMTSSGAFAHILPRVALTSAVAAGTYSDTQYFVAASAF